MTRYMPTTSLYGGSASPGDSQPLGLVSVAVALRSLPEAAPHDPGSALGKPLSCTEPASLFVKRDTNTSQTDDRGWTGTFYSLE